MNQHPGVFSCFPPLHFIPNIHMCNKNISKISGTQTLNVAQGWGRDDGGGSFSLRSELKHCLAL